MLVTTRKPGQEIVIDEHTSIVILAVHGNQVRVGITTPAGVRVDRLDAYGRQMEEVEMCEIALAEAG